MCEIVHHVSWQTLEDLEDGLRVFGMVPPSREFLAEVISRMREASYQRYVALVVKTGESHLLKREP